MNIIVFLAPAAIAMGALGLAAFLWSLKSGQYEDLEGAAHRILIDEDDDEVQPGPSQGQHP